MLSYRTMKRLIDFFMALLLLLLCMVPLTLLAIVIRLKTGPKVFFTQKRIGLHGKPFTIIKFRTMNEGDASDRGLISDADRITSLGSWLRSTSLDELPELWNVIRGDMSLVGPRPLLVEYLPLYTKEQARRHEVHSGITGWAQINGRNAISWDEKFKLDVWYVENQSFWLDVQILFLTVKKVFMREGISAAGEATMPVFKGHLISKADNER